MQLTAFRLISDFLTVFETNQEMLLMESIACHSHRPSFHAEWTITEPAVVFAFIWCQIQFKITVVTDKATNCLIPVELSSTSAVAEVLC